MFDNITGKFVAATIGKIKKPTERHAIWVGEQARLDVAFKSANFQDVPAPAIARPDAAHGQLRDVVIHVNIMRMAAAVAIECKEGVFNRQIALAAGSRGIEEALHIIVHIQVAKG